MLIFYHVAFLHTDPSANTKVTQSKKTLKKQIKDMFSGTWLKPFLISLTLFFFSTYDVGSDGIVANSFIGGTNYTKNVENQSDPVVENCTLVGKTFHVSYQSEIETEEITTYEYDCFEEDPYWGGFTLSFMFVPGFFLWISISLSLGRSGLCTSNWILICSIISMMALIPAFPVLLLLVKFLSIFHQGNEWKKLNDLMTLCEGQLESYLQVGLQTYIICVKADREPSMIQLLSLSASMLMILYSQSNAWYAAKPEDNLVQDIARKMALSLVLLMPNLAVLGIGVITVIMVPIMVKSWNFFIIAGYCLAGKVQLF